VADDDLRELFGELASQVRPVDAQEAADQAAIVDWIGSGLPKIARGRRQRRAC
jgi:hypothetical protein